MPTKTTSRTKEIHQRAYFTVKGQIGNRTNKRARTITKMVKPRLDSVVSNLNDAYFFSWLVGGTGSRFFGYLILMPSGRLKNTNSEKAFLAKPLNSSSFWISSLFYSSNFSNSSILKYSILSCPTWALLNLSWFFLRKDTRGFTLCL